MACFGSGWARVGVGSGWKANAKIGIGKKGTFVTFSSMFDANECYCLKLEDVNICLITGDI